MTRQITTHQQLPMNAVNKQLNIRALVSAPVYYVYTGLPQIGGAQHRITIRFHAGDPQEGVNGLTVEALLAICKDRLQEFRSQGGSEHNEAAISHIGEAMFHLHARTTDRILRGVGGMEGP